MIPNRAQVCFYRVQITLNILFREPEINNRATMTRQNIFSTFLFRTYTSLENRPHRKERMPRNHCWSWGRQLFSAGAACFVCFFEDRDRAHFPLFVGSGSVEDAARYHVPHAVVHEALQTFERRRHHVAVGVGCSDDVLEFRAVWSVWGRSTKKHSGRWAPWGTAGERLGRKPIRVRDEIGFLADTLRPTASVGLE